MDLSNVQKHLSYNKFDGKFVWIISKSGVSVGQIAGYKTNKGYIGIKFKNKQILAHRLAWYFTFGKLPEKEIDHINGIKTDNRIENLREVSHGENMRNLKNHREGKLAGTYFHKPSGLYHCRITTNNKVISLGYHRTEQDAHNAYKDYIKNKTKPKKLTVRDLPVGVRFSGNRYIAYISRKKKYQHLGSFDTEKEASEAYNKALNNLKNDSTVLNFGKFKFTPPFKPHS